jgi:hypothetical protein
MALKHLRQGFTYIKIDCNSFCNCEWTEERKSKITGLYDLNRSVVETFLSADTCSKLYIGRIVVIRENTDSIITRKLIYKKP